MVELAHLLAQFAEAIHAAQPERLRGIGYWDRPLGVRGSPRGGIRVQGWDQERLRFEVFPVVAAAGGRSFLSVFRLSVLHTSPLVAWTP